MTDTTESHLFYTARQILSLSVLEMGKAIGYKGKSRNIRNQVDRIERAAKEISPRTMRAVNKLLTDAGHEPCFNVSADPETATLGPAYAHVDLQTGKTRTGKTADIVKGLPLFEGKILKVQRAMGGMDGVLIYDESRAIYYECHDPEFMPHVIDQLNGLYKAYWFASFDGERIIKHRDASLAEQF